MYNIHYKEIVPPHYVDVIMVAPSGPGYAVRQEYKSNRGIPTLVAVNQDVTGKARETALAYSKAIEILVAAISGVTAPSGDTVAFKRRNGSTTSLTITYGTTEGERTVSTIA